MVTHGFTFNILTRFNLILKISATIVSRGLICRRKSLFNNKYNLIKIGFTSQKFQILSFSIIRGPAFGLICHHRLLISKIETNNDSESKGVLMNLYNK